MSIEEFDWGKVKVIAGPWEDEIGNYDDDEEGKAIVYFNDGYELLSYEDLEPWGRGRKQ